MNKVLDTLYNTLDFKSGALFTATDTPSPGLMLEDWMEKGEWLAAAKRAGADKVLFVKNNPVAIFAECSSGYLEKERAFNRIWCLGRPRLLFLASPGELTVLDLAQKPVNLSEIQEDNSVNRDQMKPLATLIEVEKIAQELQQFHRDNIESGKVFGDNRFGNMKYRADKALIRDLKTVRRELIQTGLSGPKLKFAHALIGRSIFIRYLEDRGILTYDYFLKVASKGSRWKELLDDNSPRAGLNFSDCEAFYPRVLQSKELTYALFRELAKDFNGDMFPEINEEEQVISQEHLSKIQDLLYGDVGIQKQLFFYSYRFDIIPLDLISSIYEEFYDPSTNDDEKQNKARQDGAYYTPTVLAEFVLSRLLTVEEMESKPRVLDPACGSGIFLVESFRRIVRYEWFENQERPSFDTLKQILCKQITGIEVNEEAARITAFSLYLAMLHYLEPPAITEQIKHGNKLPNLLATKSKSKNNYNCIWIGNTFNTAEIESEPLWASRFGQHCADIIICNPPWGAPGKKADDTTKDREKMMLEWCNFNRKPIGDMEPSQAFLWRSLDLLKDGGKAAMLVSAGVLFKHNSTTRAFRKQWMDSVRLTEVFNFTHVRKLFFKGADSPFVIICYVKDKQIDFPVMYGSAKQVKSLKETQAVLFSKYDVHILRNEDLTSSELWKSYWFGSFTDVSFLKQLRFYDKLKSFVDREKSGQGISPSPEKYSTEDISTKRILNINSFQRYIHTDNLVFEVLPKMVYRLGKTNVYFGPRVLIRRGIDEKSEPKGQIIARYEDQSFCFTNAINGIKLKSGEEWQYKTLLGITWSSLARYYFFLTASNWGLWHHEIHLDDEILQLPVVFDPSNPSTLKIISIVDKLCGYSAKKLDYHVSVSESENDGQRRILENELDEAVFDLYGLNEEQKDLIRDCCEVTIPFFYKPFDSIGTFAAVFDNDISWLEHYIYTFARRWNAYLENNMEMRAEIHIGLHANMLAIEFFPADKTDPWNLNPQNDSWQYILEEIGEKLPQPMGISQILMDGIVHIVSDDAVIVIKRNEKRFWTRSLAREDADATLCKRIIESNSNSDGGNK